MFAFFSNANKLIIYLETGTLLAKGYYFSLATKYVRLKVLHFFVTIPVYNPTSFPIIPKI